MKKGALTLIIFLFLVATAYLALKAREPAPVAAGAAPKPLVIQKAEDITQYIRAPRKERKAIVALSESEHAPFKSECVDYFDSLESLNLMQWDTLEKRPKYRSLLRRPEKCTLNDPFLERMHTEFAKSCRIRGKVRVIDEAVEREYREPLSNDCVEKIFYLRAALTRLTLRDRPLAEITELQALLDLLLTEFLLPKKDSPPDYAKIRATAERLLELSPNLYLALKTLIYSQAHDAMETPSSDARDEKWKKAESQLARANELRPADDRLEDARAAITTQGFDPDRTLKYSSAYIAKYPSAGRGYYLKAYGEWKKNSKDASIAALTRATELELLNLLYRDTLAEIKKPDAKIEVFKSPFTFGISAEDFQE